MFAQEQPSHDNLRINRLLLIATRPSYQDVFQRSYSIHANDSTINKLSAVFSTAGVGHNLNLQKTTLAQTIPEIVRLSTAPIGMAEIPHGWRTQRVRFLLEVESNVGNMTMVSYLQGYSEYYDPTITGRLDPVMPFYINSITNVIRMIDPVTHMYRVMPKSTFNVVTDLAGGKRYQEIDGMDDLKLIRPKDIIENIATMEMYSDYASNIINTTGSIGGRVNTSKKSNNDPISYFSSTVNSYIESKNLITNSSDHTDLLRQASNIVDEHSVMSVPFMYKLHAMTNDFNPSTFTLDLLRAIDPQIQAKSQLIDNVNDIMSPSFNTALDSDNTAGMMQPTIENMKATMIAQSINSLMVECLVSSLSVSFTNTSGQPVVIISDVKSFIEGIDLTAYASKIETNIRNILLPSVTDGGLSLIEVSLHSDVLGDTNVFVGVNLNHPVLFRFPTFADSLYLPVLSDAQNKASTIEDFANVFDLTTMANPTMSAHYM